MTFSIVARCEASGAFGVAVASSSPAVAARCAYARSGVGAVASQNVTDPTLGPRSLDLMALGASADQAIAALCGSTDHMEYRQVLAVDARGRTAIHSGSKALGVWSAAIAGLASLWEVYKPQMDAYVIRALNPAGAPSYGVPGDL
jgi:uncharacterized Ntn-hydrolase superfamily protein